MSSLPWEVVSRHVLGRLHARDARGVCQAFRSAFDAGVTTMTMEGSAHAGANDTSAERALQLILGSPGLRQLDIDDTCPFKADALRAAAARGPNLQHLRLYLPANRPIRATDALHAVATALAQHHGNLATLEIVAGRDSVSALAPALQALTSLRALILSDTSLRLNDVVPVLRALTGLERLDLADNSLLEDDADDGAAADLGAALRSLPALRALDLSSNGIGPAGVAALAPALASLSALRELSLGSNAIGCDGAVHLASALASKTALTTLDVSANDLGALGAAGFASWLVWRLRNRGAELRERWPFLLGLIPVAFMLLLKIFDRVDVVRFIGACGLGITPYIALSIRSTSCLMLRSWERRSMIGYATNWPGP